MDNLGSAAIEAEYRKIETTFPKVSELLQIPVKDCNESLVEVEETAGLRTSFHNLGDLGLLNGARILVRERVKLMLEEAGKNLQRDYADLAICLFYGYRRLEIQRQFFASAVRKMQTQYPDLSEEGIIEKAHALSAHPEVAGHPTGGAVDVTLISLETGKFLDLGVPVFREDYLNAGRKIYTFSPEISESARNWRIVLRDQMTRVGFTAFNGEFWHFSYGDREWAYNKSRKRNENLDATYQQI